MKRVSNEKIPKMTRERYKWSYEENYEPKTPRLREREETRERQSNYINIKNLINEKILMIRRKREINNIRTNQ